MIPDTTGIFAHMQGVHHWKLLDLLFMHIIDQDTFDRWSHLEFIHPPKTRPLYYFERS